MSASDQRAIAQEKLPGIFISYRRSDNPDATGRIYDRLVSEFGKARVFKDVDSIPLGQDFRGHLNEIVGSCAVVLAIIGPRWTDARNSAGQRRLEDADDFVRIELEAALARNIPVVPVLVAHAAMPGTSDLPASLASMVYRQSIEVRPDPDFHNDATRLVSALRQMLDPNAPAAESAMSIASGVTSSLVRRSNIRFFWAVALAAAAIVVAAVLAIPAQRHWREKPPGETRIAITVPFQEDFALSPDGRQIVYVARGDGEYRLWLRALDTTEPQPLEGTQGGHHPFWSPDGRSIGFFADGSLKRLDLGGGPPQNLAPVTNERLDVGVWSTNGDILFTSGPGQPLARIASFGGPVTVVVKAGRMLNGRVPMAAIPDGRHFLYLDTDGKSGGIFLAALDGRSPVRLTTDIGPAAWLRSGWMVWRRLDASAGTGGGSLLAQRLDLANAKLTGAPISIAGGVGAFSVAASGLVAFETVRVAGQQQLTWVDRSGKEIGTVGNSDGTLSAPRIAPDGRRVVVSKVVQGNRDLWLLDGARASRLTVDAARDTWPVWSLDGQRITFSSDRTGNFALYQKKLDSGPGGETSIQTPDQGAYASGWSPDGRYLLYFALPTKGSIQIRMLSKSADHKTLALMKSASADVWGQFSPDGRWVAYHSNQSGQNQVFVQRFNSPGVEGGEGTDSTTGEKMVSTAGGISPMWSTNGKEIYFINPRGEMMAVPIGFTDAAIVPGTPVKLFDAQVLNGGEDQGREYDVARDGRFLINRVRDSNPMRAITLLQNWNPEPMN